MSNKINNIKTKFLEYNSKNIIDEDVIKGLVKAGWTYEQIICNYPNISPELLKIIFPALDL